MKIEKESLSTRITDEERAEAVQDEYGVSYTKDWKKLIYAPKKLTTYTIKEETKVIGDWAFYKCFLSADLSRKEKTNFINKKRHPENLSR